MQSEESKPIDKNALIFLAIMIVIMAIAFWYGMDEDERITQNKKVTIGIVVRSSKPKKHINFTYFVNGKEFDGRDSRNDGYPSRVRLGKVIKGAYYQVEYDSTDHTNHRIVIGENPINPREEVRQNGQTIEGCIQKNTRYDDYRDLYINYTIKDALYSFRTRLHKDSISLYDSKACKNQKTITLEVSRTYPILNDLYFKSRDRQYKGAYSTQGKRTY